MYSQLAMIDDYIRATHLPYVKYLTERAESGNAKVVIELPIDLTYINATVVTPVHGYKYIEIPTHHHHHHFEGMTMGKTVPHPGWHSVMDNTHFSVSVLNKFTQELSSKLSTDVNRFLFIDDYFKTHKSQIFFSFLRVSVFTP